MLNVADVKMPKAGYLACFVGHAALLVLAYFIYWQHGAAPLTGIQIGLMVVCVLSGGILSVLPFFLEYRAAVKMVETGAVVSMISQFENLQEISEHIKNATAQWQGVQECSAKTAVMGKEIADKMMSEVAGFAKFMQQASDGEKNTLRLEIDKLRRGENEFVQIIVRMLDHIYALNQAAVRSGQPGLIEQLGHFQASCRDVARRVGLVPYVPAVNELFDPAAHQSADSQAMPVSNARISEVIATGYSYQGAMLRPALVALQNQAGIGGTGETPALTDANPVLPELTASPALPEAPVEVASAVAPPEKGKDKTAEPKPSGKPSRQPHYPVAEEQTLL
jgi:molecular chaperone GrpE (heat shock protein)